MINRHGKCYGLTLFRWNRRQLEIWFCPVGEYIEPHSHPKIDSVIIPLVGSMCGTIGDKLGMAKKFHRYVIPANTRHAARVTGWCCIFANWETWKERNAVTSAAVDFEGV